MFNGILLGENIFNIKMYRAWNFMKLTTDITVILKPKK